MNRAARVIIVGFILTAASWELRADEDKEKEKDKPALKAGAGDFTYLQRYWGLQLKDSLILPLRKTKFDGDYIDIELLFEFEKDLTFSELLELRDALNLARVHFVFQDKNKIIFAESKKFKIEGQITGFKGDAFLIRTEDIRPATFLRAQKMIARQAEF
jgi:hypothetical protein